MVLRLRELTAEERSRVERLAHSRTAAARRVERARIIWHASQGQSAPAIAAQFGLDADTARGWIRRFNAEGLAGLEDRPRAGRPPTYSPEQVAEVVAAALTAPEALGLPFACWTLDRLAAYLNEHKRIPIRRSRIDELLRAEGLRWRRHESWFGARVDPEFAEKRGGSRPSTRPRPMAPPHGSIVVCLDEMGPEGAKTYPGSAVVQARAGQAGRAGRATQEIDYGRRGKGYIFGAFRPATGDALTRPYGGRGTASWVDFLERVELWLPAEAERVYAIVDNLSSHRATDVLLFLLAHPRWEMVFQPKYAAYLNLIEPWWKVLRSLALKGRRFESWGEIVRAVAEATAYWNAHRHPFVWGHRRRHKPRRQPGIALSPKAA